MLPPTLTPDTVDLIRCARRRVESLERWTTGEFGLDANGLRISEEDLRHTPTSACSYCAMGALITEHRLAWICYGKIPDLAAATEALAHAALKILPAIGGDDMVPGQIVAELNDRDFDPLTGELEDAHLRERHIQALGSRPT
jgi:hypothetical protein